MSSFSAFEYSNENLIECFSKETNNPKGVVGQKLHVIFFQNYFYELSAQTFVIENEYVDHDYLEDYTYYYVKSFKNYKRFCKRLHFFSLKFTEQEFGDILLQKDGAYSNSELQKNYLGFIVLKPLPKTYIGRTCLKTYPTESNRHFPFSRTYNINLFGLELSVESIAFQEQDSVVAACASSAIWSAFQVTGKLFQHFIPTPAEITKSAIDIIPGSSRHFPNNGLTAEQMAQAIRNVGLDPYLVVKTDNDILKATVYAYQKARIPLIMGMDLENAESKKLGKHAVTITGYSMTNSISKFHDDEFYLTSSKISKLYVHDDQVGPFARMEFQKEDRQLTTSWGDVVGNEERVIGKPDILIIPLYPKIRISLETIMLTIIQLNGFINYITNKTLRASPKIEWDIFLSKSNELKNEIHKSKQIEYEDKEQILLSSLPRYVWRAIGLLEEERIEFIFDSTDIEQGDIFIRYISHGNKLLNLLKLVANYIDLSQIDCKPLIKIIDSLRI